MLTSILQRLMENVKKRGKKGEYWKNVVILHRSFSIERNWWSECMDWKGFTSGTVVATHPFYIMRPYTYI